MRRVVYCPVNGWDCPYWQETGVCTLENHMECGDFATFWDEDEDYVSYEEDDE